MNQFNTELLKKLVRDLENKLQEQELELKELRSWKQSMIEDDPYHAEQQPNDTVNLFEQGFKDCGDTGDWEYVEFDDIDGGCGTETWHNKKTGKYYAVEVERVRRAECAEELTNGWEV